MRTRQGKKQNPLKDPEKMDASGSSIGETSAPTAEHGRKKAEQELQIYKAKNEWQSEQIQELRKENDYLKEQLAAALKKEAPAVAAPNKVLTFSSGSAASSPEKSSPESTCKSSSSDSSSDSSKEKAQKPKKRKGKELKQKRRKEKKEKSTRNKAKDPDHVVARYMKILRIHRRGGTMSSVFHRCAVDRNTIVATIAELHVAAPHKYEELEKERPRKLAEFAAQCSAAIKEDSEIENRINVLKNTEKLLPLKSKADMP